MITNADLTHPADLTKPYIIMDFAGFGSGVNLAMKIGKQRKLWSFFTNKTQREQSIKNEVGLLAFQVLLGLQALHVLGIYHLDIKPNNIFGNIKTGFRLGDYGLSKTREMIQNIIQTTIRGTKGYCSPETGTPAYTPDGHDSYATGISLLAILNNRCPSGEYPLKLYIKSLDRTFILAFKNDTDFNKANNLTSGIDYDTRALAGNTLEEVIAKLLDADPKRRIKAEEALNLPYFQQPYFNKHLKIRT